MQESDALHRRGQAMEDEFFHRVDEKLRENLRAKIEREESRTRLAAATHIEDATLLDHLLDADISSSSIAALTLVPVVFVAWADGSVTAAERQAIIHAALNRGIKDQPTAFALLEGWLEERPKNSLMTLWNEYFCALRQSLAPTLSEVLANEIMQLATHVAEASGGYFGRGKVSADEQKVLDHIKQVLFTHENA